MKKKILQTISFYPAVPIFFLLFFCIGIRVSAQQKKTTTAVPDGAAQRQYFIQSLTKIADPLLNALSKNELRKLMPVEAVKGAEQDRKNFTYLEATGRLLTGMAPWLELGPDETPEGRLRKKYIDLAVTCIKNATDPASPDHMNFNKGDQPVVDAAFLAQALLRAPTQLWGNLDEKTKANVIADLKSTRVILPFYSNWLLFSAMIESALMKFDHSGDRMRIDYAIRSHMTWYKGDGVYGDGPSFHWDYYNSFVIQPMLLEVLKILEEEGQRDRERRTYELVLTRAQRYAAIQERLISPEGTYPPIGRSLAYRFGAFQHLSQIALMKKLPKEVSPQQVRFALFTMVKKQLEAPGTFDAAGWLRIGIYGQQPNIGEGYISTGSLYLCSTVFLILGLPANDAFWTAPNENWTQKKIWNGEAIPIDHAIE
jgi:hypothetical protein